MQKIDSIRLFDGISHIDPALVEEASSPLKTKRPYHLVKAGAFAASFAFAALVLLSINAAFPAFAESLPLIGEVFRQLNSLGSNAPSYGGVVQPVGESAENNQYKLTVTEAYCDGDYVFFALRLQAKDSKLLKMESLKTEESVYGSHVPGWSVSINGESGGLVYDLPAFTRKGSCFESNPIKIALPDNVDLSSPIQVEAVIGNLSGRTQEAIDKNEAGQIVSIEPVSLQFDLEPNTSYNRQIVVQNTETDGLELQGWSISPSKLSVALAFPYFDMAGVRACARTDDGQDLGRDMRESGDFGDGRYTFGDTAVQECTFVGPAEGTKQVIITVYNEYPNKRSDSAAVFGEFTIDLETGEAAATADYRAEGLEHFSIRAYADEKMEEARNSAKAIAPSRSPVPGQP